MAGIKHIHQVWERTQIRGLHCLCRSEEDIFLRDTAQGTGLPAGMWATNTPHPSTKEGETAVVPRKSKSLHLALPPVALCFHNSSYEKGFHSWGECPTYQSYLHFDGLSKSCWKYPLCIYWDVWDSCSYHGFFVYSYFGNISSFFPSILIHNASLFLHKD